MPHRKALSIARIASQMKLEGLSQADMVEKTEESLSTVRRRMKAGFKVGGLFLWARALNCSAGYLAGERDTPDRAEWLTEDERVMLEQYRKLTSAEKRAVINTIQEAHSVLTKERCQSGDTT